jgi:hypothetical protein
MDDSYIKLLYVTGSSFGGGGGFFAGFFTLTISTSSAPSESLLDAS